jgi:phytoene dehydrogenase-like protein
MARVVVVGGGFGGLASAARLAKLGHEVTLVEASAQLGGSLVPVEADGYRWDAAAAMTLLPAVIRDLFRKSGRPVERELELVDQPIIREHHFEDGSRVQVPGASRTAQLAAFDELAAGYGEQWCDYVASFSDDWDLLRRGYFENPWQPADAPHELTRLLESREHLQRRLRKTFRDERLRLVAAHPFLFSGHQAVNVPAWMGSVSYVEQTFGAWRVPGGMGLLADALRDRLATRGVTVMTETPVRDLVVPEGRAAGVLTDHGTVPADLVVCAIDPRRLPALAAYVDRTMPAIPPVTTYLGLSGDVPDLGPEAVFHGDPTIVVRTGGTAPDGCHAWTVHARGKLVEDMLTALQRVGLDLRDNVRVRLHRTPRALVEGWGGSPEGVMWQGRSTVRHRLGPETPIPGVYAAGAHATPGGGLPFVGLSAAQVAASIGPAE